jgi:protein-disulfide isomerase
LLVIVTAALALGCGGSAADVDALKQGQEKILAKLDGLEKTVANIKAAPAPAARPQIDPNKVYNIPVGNSPVKGPKNAKVTIVEWADYQCPFCAQAHPLFEQVLKEYPNDVNFVFKQFPLPATMHPNAMPAAKAALAAGKQGKFWEMHEVLFQNLRELGPDKLKEYAGRVGVNVAQWEKDLASAEIQAQIDREMAEGRSADVTGTPTIFVNGKRLQNRSIEGFKQAIEDAKKG